MTTTDVAAGIRSVNHWIGGKACASESGRSGVVWNPATGQAQAAVDFASAEEVDQAVESAKQAFPGWRATPLSRRAEILFKVRELVDANRRPIAEMITLEHGKTVSDALGEVARGLENIEFSCGVPNGCAFGNGDRLSIDC